MRPKIKENGAELWLCSLVHPLPRVVRLVGVRIAAPSCLSKRWVGLATPSYYSTRWCYCHGRYRRRGVAVVLSSLAILSPIVVVVVCHAVVVGGIVIVGPHHSCWGDLRCGWACEVGYIGLV